MNTQNTPKKHPRLLHPLLTMQLNYFHADTLDLTNGRPPSIIKNKPHTGTELRRALIRLTFAGREALAGGAGALGEGDLAGATGGPTFSYLFFFPQMRERERRGVNN